MANRRIDTTIIYKFSHSLWACHFVSLYINIKLILFYVFYNFDILKIFRFFKFKRLI